MKAVFPAMCIVSALLVGCGGGGVVTKTERPKGGARAEPHTHQVCLFAGGLPEAFKYVELGRIKATKRTYGSVEELPAAMADAARRIGADAIINMQAEQKFKGPLPWRINSPTGDGQAIKLAEDSPKLECTDLGGRLL